MKQGTPMTRERAEEAPVCETCSNEHPTVTHDSDCEWWLGIDAGECICGDNVVGPSGYVSVPTECIDNATN